jgi:hypothetical protein
VFGSHQGFCKADKKRKMVSANQSRRIGKPHTEVYAIPLTRDDQDQDVPALIVFEPEQSGPPELQVDPTFVHTKIPMAVQ